MILLLDNYDSFVHNLARYFRRLGYPTTVIRSDQIDAESCGCLSPDAIVISPGPGHPNDAGCSVDVVRQHAPRIPILGVCLGHQAIGIAFGASVTQCEPMHGMASTMTHDASHLFIGCGNPMTVGRYHSLAIDEQTLPTQLVVTARSSDGVVMGVRHQTKPVFGVQFHPESVLTADGLRLIQNFLVFAESGQRQPDGSLGETVT